MEDKPVGSNSIPNSTKKKGVIKRTTERVSKMFSRTQSFPRNIEDFQSIMKHPDYAFDGIDITSSRASKTWTSFNFWPSRKGELQNDPRTPINNQELYNSLVQVPTAIPTGYGGMEVPISSSPVEVNLHSMKRDIGIGCWEEIKKLGECKKSSKNPGEDCKVDALLLADCASKVICPDQRKLFLLQCKSDSTGRSCHESAHQLDRCWANRGLPTGGLTKP